MPSTNAIAVEPDVPTMGTSINAMGRSIHEDPAERLEFPKPPVFPDIPAFDDNTLQLVEIRRIVISLMNDMISQLRAV